MFEFHYSFRGKEVCYFGEFSLSRVVVTNANTMKELVLGQVILVEGSQHSHSLFIREFEYFSGRRCVKHGK